VLLILIVYAIENEHNIKITKERPIHIAPQYSTRI